MVPALHDLDGGGWLALFQTGSIDGPSEPRSFGSPPEQHRGGEAGGPPRSPPPIRALESRKESLWEAARSLTPSWWLLLRLRVASPAASRARAHPIRARRNFRLSRRTRVAAPLGGCCGSRGCKRPAGLSPLLPYFSGWIFLSSSPPLFLSWLNHQLQWGEGRKGADFRSSPLFAPPPTRLPSTSQVFFHDKGGDDEKVSGGGGSTSCLAGLLHGWEGRAPGPCCLFPSSPLPSL